MLWILSSEYRINSLLSIFRGFCLVFRIKARISRVLSFPCKMGTGTDFGYAFVIRCYLEPINTAKQKLLYVGWWSEWFGRFSLFSFERILLPCAVVMLCTTVMRVSTVWVLENGNSRRYNQGSPRAVHAKSSIRCNSLSNPISWTGIDSFCRTYFLLSSLFGVDSSTRRMISDAATPVA